MPKGIHALHFHEVGKCEPPFKTAGGHFNPTRAEGGSEREESWFDEQLSAPVPCVSIRAGARVGSDRAQG